MVNFLVKRFVKDYENISDNKVRERYGMLGSFVGIVCNVVLFIGKFLIGTIANSIAIVSDGFNNLSDCATCVITMFGYKMATKPADKDHPFGHGRMEYLTSLALSMIIVLVGIELLRGSVEKLIHPDDVNFSAVALIVLIMSILIKLWMFMFNRRLGNRISSGVMLATAKDSLNDVLATTATLIALVASCFTDLPVDGVMGIIVSLLIIMTGVEIVKETVDELLGKPADKELVDELIGLVEASDISLGMHDLVVHNYGPGNMLGSMHVEVDCKGDIMMIHDAIDCLEREIYDKLKIIMTIHMDPVETDNEILNSNRELVKGIIESINKEYAERLCGKLTMHDFRMVPGHTHTNVIFDVVLPSDNKMNSKEIEELITKMLNKEKQDYHPHITFDRAYCE